MSKTFGREIAFASYRADGEEGEYHGHDHGA